MDDFAESSPMLSAYSGLLLETTSSRRQVQRLRDEWVSRLGPDKRNSLFEFEVLLRATSSFGNSRNHPGKSSELPEVARDFHPAAVLFRQGLKQLVQLARNLLGERDRSFVFHQYVETITPEDSLRKRITEDQARGSSPEDDLLVLRRVFTQLSAVAEAISQLDRLPHKSFYALSQLAAAEAARSPIFTPFRNPWFRPEFDQIRSQRVLELLRNAPGSGTQRVLSYTFLTLFRLIRYLETLRIIASEPGSESPYQLGRLYMMASVLVSDARSLASWLTHRSGEMLAQSYGELLERVPASEISASFDQLRALGVGFVDMRGTFESVAANLRLELRRFLIHDLPTMDEAIADPAGIPERFTSAASQLLPAIQNLVLFLGHSVGGHLETDEVFDDKQVQTELSVRLRSHVWMFTQIVRAFMAKVEAALHEEVGWSPRDDFAFVFEFIRYFKSLGYPLLRARDQATFKAYLRVLARLEKSSHLTVDMLADTLEPSREFLNFLSQLFSNINQRQELQDVPFDKKEAARALQLYLGR